MIVLDPHQVCTNKWVELFLLFSSFFIDTEIIGKSSCFELFGMFLTFFEGITMCLYGGREEGRNGGEEGGGENDAKVDKE